MTLGELITKARKLFADTYEDAALADWAADMDGRILLEDYLRKEFKIEYDAEADRDTELLLGKPWEEMYMLHLQERVHFYRGEYEDAANFTEQYNRMHKAWLKNLLMTVPTDCLGRPWLADVAFVRRGSDGVVHLRTLFRLEDIERVEVYVVQDETVKIHVQDEDERLLIADGWMTVNLTGEDTALLSKGSADLVVMVHTVAGERYESDAAQIRVLQSRLEGVTA